MEATIKRGPGRPPKAEKAQIVEQATRNASNIQVVDNVDSLADNTKKQLPGPDDLGSTSERLFPDSFSESNTTEVEPEPTNNTELLFPSQQVEQPSEPPAQQEQAEDVLDIDSIKGKKFKAVIGGQEKVVPIEELVKGYQTDQYLSQKGNKLYEERKALAEERQRLEQQRLSPYQVPDQVPQDDEYLQKLERRLARIEGNLGQIAQGTQHAVYESNQKRLAEELKQEGFDDFFEYVPKMKQYISELKDDRMVMFYDTYEGGKALYQQLKNKELMGKLKAQEAGKGPQPVGRPPIVRIDAGQSAGTPTDNRGEKLRDAFNRARSTGDPDDWNTYLSMKGVI